MFSTFLKDHSGDDRIENKTAKCNENSQEIGIFQARGYADR